MPRKQNARAKANAKAKAAARRLTIAPPDRPTLTEIESYKSPPIPKPLVGLLRSDILRNYTSRKTVVKHNGLKEQAARRIANYLLHCDKNEQKDLIYRMFNLVPPLHMAKIMTEYSKLRHRLIIKVKKRVSIGRNLPSKGVVALDANGVIHA